MIRSYKPRGFLWNCASPFQQTVEFRNIRYGDCVSSVHGAALDDLECDLVSSEPAAKRRRVEELADDFLNGTPLEIPTARLSRSPFWAQGGVGVGSLVLSQDDGHASSDTPVAQWVEEKSDRDIIRAASHPSACIKPPSRAGHTGFRKSARLSSLDESLYVDEFHAQAACRPQMTSRIQPVFADLIADSSRPTPEVTNDAQPADAYKFGTSMVSISSGDDKTLDDDGGSPSVLHSGAGAKQPESSARRNRPGQARAHLHKTHGLNEELQYVPEESNIDATTTIPSTRSVLREQNVREDVSGAGHVNCLEVTARSVEEGLSSARQPTTKRKAPVRGKRKRHLDHPSRVTNESHSPFRYRVRKTLPTHVSKEEVRRRHVSVSRDSDESSPAFTKAHPKTTSPIEDIRAGGASNMLPTTTPIGDRHLNAILPKDPAPTRDSLSLKRSIIAEWRRSGADISTASNSPTPSPSDDLSHAVPPVHKTTLPPRAPNPSFPTQTDATPGLLSKAKQSFFASARRPSSSNPTQHKSGEASLESPTTTSISSQPLTRQPSLRRLLPLESLPATQTVLDGWKGFLSTVKKTRDGPGKGEGGGSGSNTNSNSMRGSDSAPEGNEDSLVLPDLQGSRRGSDTGVRDLSLAGTDVDGLAGVREKGTGRVGLGDGVPSFTELGTGHAEEGVESQALLLSSRELIDEHLGDAVAFKAMLNQ